jgi:hypothetical protein
MNIHSKLQNQLTEACKPVDIYGGLMRRLSSCCFGENRDDAVSFTVRSMLKACGDPHDVLDFLLLQLDVCIERSKMELAFKS